MAGLSTHIARDARSMPARFGGVGRQDSGRTPRSRDSTRLARPAMVDFAGALAARVVQMGLALATGVYLARALGPSGRGSLAVITITVGQAVMLSSMGVDTAVVHFAGRRSVPPAALFRASARLAFFLGLGGALGGLLVLGAFVPKEVAADVRTCSVLLAGTIPLTLLILYSQAIIRSTGRIVEASAMAVIDGASLLAAAVVAVEAGWGLPGIVCANAVVEILMLGLAMAILARIGVVGPGPRANNSLARRLAVYGAKGHLGTALQGLNYRLDVFLVAAFLEPGDVGIYTVVVGVAEFLWLVPNVLGILLLQQSATESDLRATTTTTFATRVVSVITVAACILWLFCAEPLLRLVYGGGFSEGANALRLLLPGMWSLAIWKMLANDLGGRGRPFYKSSTAAAGVFVTFVLDLVLIPTLGIEGAAIASSAAYAVTAGTMVWLYSRTTGASLSSLFLPSTNDWRRLVKSVRAVPRVRSGAPAAPSDPPGRRDPSL